MGLFCYKFVFLTTGTCIILLCWLLLLLLHTLPYRRRKRDSVKFDEKKKHAKKWRKLTNMGKVCYTCRGYGTFCMLQ